MLDLQGSGQGNGAGPSMVLFDIIHWKGYGMKLRSALLDEVIDLVGFGFVKDTDLVENGTAMKTIIEVANKLQKSIDW